ncbi:MAG: capsule assembly Wzi family protein [candidate division Zixibacteria bacterium]
MPVNIPSSDNLILIGRELYGRGLIEDLEYYEFSPTTERGVTEFEKGLIINYECLISEYIFEYRGPEIVNGLELVEVNRQKGSDNSNYIKIFPKTRIDLRSNLRATVTYRIDRELSEDPRYDGKYWRGWAGFVEDAGIKLSFDNLKFRFGFERLARGFGNYGNLLFSRQAHPMTVFGFNFVNDKIRFESISGFLSPLKEELDGRIDDPNFFTNQQRYLAAHSLSIKPLRGLTVSFREAVIYGGPGRRFEPAYAFPLIWYHGYQLNSRMDDNTLVSVGLDYRHGGRFWVYGELLVDDFQIEKSSDSDYEPAQLGFLMGGEAYDLGFEGTGLRVEYARVNNWVYNQPRPHNRFINHNIPIGFPDGPDNDNLNWELSWWPSENLRLAYFGIYQRVGEGSIGAEWTAPWLGTDGYDEPFPTGVVQEKSNNGLRFLALNKNRFWGKLEIQLTDIKNVRNIPEGRISNWEFSLEIGYNLPPFGWGL